MPSRSRRYDTRDSMLRHFFSRQFLLFIFAGASSASINWSSRILLNLWFSFPVAVAGAYVFGVGSAFLFNRLFVFNREQPIARQALGFVLTNLAFLPVVELAAVSINTWLIDIGFQPYSREVAHAIAIALPMAATFLIYKFIIFKAPAAAPVSGGPRSATLL